MFAAVAAFGVVAVTVAAPFLPGATEPPEPAPVALAETQSFVSDDIDGAADLARAAFEVQLPPPPAPAAPVAAAPLTAPASGTPDPGTAQAIAHEMVTARGWGQGEFDCLVALWNRESGWNVYAHNRSSGAYGIPQSLPGNKMASAGADWQSNPATQISWGLGYIENRYGAPCGAWGSSQQRGWY